MEGKYEAYLKPYAVSHELPQGPHQGCLHSQERMRITVYPQGALCLSTLRQGGLNTSTAGGFLLSSLYSLYSTCFSIFVFCICFPCSFLFSFLLQSCPSCHSKASFCISELYSEFQIHISSYKL